MRKVDLCRLGLKPQLIYYLESISGGRLTCCGGSPYSRSDYSSSSSSGSSSSSSSPISDFFCFLFVTAIALSLAYVIVSDPVGFVQRVYLTFANEWFEELWWIFNVFFSVLFSFAWHGLYCTSYLSVSQCEIGVLRWTRKRPVKKLCTSIALSNLPPIPPAPLT